MGQETFPMGFMSFGPARGVKMLIGNISDHQTRGWETTDRKGYHIYKPMRVLSCQLGSSKLIIPQH